MRPSAENNPFAPRNYGSLEQVTERCYIFRNIVNSHIYVGDNGLAVIDTQVNHGLARRLLKTLQDTFSKPILYAINTHYHWDHTNGNAVFKDAGAELVGNRDTADFMRSKAPRQKKFLSSRGFELGPDPLLHDIFMEDCNSFDLGNLTLQLQRGH
ncbi:MAG: MBL fold metallo-hydrolase, partial [Planctomycetes bacterium]|nr:MBL fold metallo-hydrolase [Planctomycetota bacterium]